MSSLAIHKAVASDDAGFVPVITSSKKLKRRRPGAPPAICRHAGRPPRQSYYIVDVDNNFVNTIMPAAGEIQAAGVGDGSPEMSPAKRRIRPRRGPVVALRKTPQMRRASRPIVDLDVLNDRLGYFVRRMQVWVFQDFIRRLSSIDISPAQFSVLVVISANSGLSQMELATTLGIERARLVRMLHRLERRGLTQRLASSADRRRHALRLTRDGQKILARAKALAAEHETALKERLGPERHRLLLDSLREF
jgi:DNA-binding MarR family transcriptional regulator